MNKLKAAVKRPTSPTSPSYPSSAPARSKPSVPPNRKVAGDVDLAFILKIGLVVLAIVAAFFIYRSMAVQSQLTKTRNEGAQLQSQLNKLQIERDQAQTKARESSDQATRLQVQADQAKADVASAKAGAEKASGEVAGLRTQLDQAKRQAAEAKAGADKTAAQVTQLQAQLAALARAQAQTATTEPAKPAEAGQTAPVKPAVSSLKKMPLNASFKKAPMLDGNALLIQNTSTASLSLTVKFSNPSGSKEFPVTLEPGAVKEMGWLGAWVLAAGDKVEITSPGCDTIQKTAP
jgi:cytoskeletal protein RodZ